MTDESTAAPEQKVPKQASDQEINQAILKPIDELVKSMQVHDGVIRQTIGTIKRLWKKSKGAGQVSLTEHVQLFSALYGLLNLKSTQDVIVGQQLSADIDRLRWHLFALQNYVLEKTLGGAEPEEAEGKPLKGRALKLFEAWKVARDRINTLYKEEQEQAKEKRRLMFEQHKQEMLDGALKEMDRPEIKKDENVDAKPGPKLVLPN